MSSTPIRINANRRLFRWKRHGFTLIELLVVIAVIAVLVSMLLPALQNARAQAKKVVCAVQLKQLGMIWISYADDSGDALPPQPNPLWNATWDFVHDELDRQNTTGGGKVFYCPDYVFQINSLGEPIDWDNPWYTRELYDVYMLGYDIFTNVLNWNFFVSPQENTWESADGMKSASPSWHYAWTAADPVYDNLIPPKKTTERRHKARVGGWQKSFTIIPDETPMIFDQAHSTPDTNEFVKKDCRHFNASKGVPYAVNAVYMDGHVYGRIAEDIAVLRNCNPYQKRWF